MNVWRMLQHPKAVNEIKAALLEGEMVNVSVHTLQIAFRPIVIPTRVYRGRVIESNHFRTGLKRYLSEPACSAAYIEYTSTSHFRRIPSSRGEEPITRNGCS